MDRQTELPWHIRAIAYMLSHVKTSLDLLEQDIDSECQWHQLGHMQICTSPQRDYHASIPPLAGACSGISKVSRVRVRCKVKVRVRDRRRDRRRHSLSKLLREDLFANLADCECPWLTWSFLVPWRLLIVYIM